MQDGFAGELARYGPEGAYARPALAEAQGYCSRLARTHYENFSVASFLLPRRLLQHFHNVYAYCRWADDLGDETGGGERAIELLGWWRRELLACYDGKPHHPVMVALAETIQRFHIPSQPFLDLLIAFEQDQRVQRYETYEELLGYCKRSANPVGHLVLYLFEEFTAERAELADHICTALQLTNFWQDVSRDLDIGRVYLPGEDRRRFGYTEEELAARCFTPAFAELMRFEVERARALLERGQPLLEQLRPEHRPDVALFVGGGLGVLRKIEQQGYNVWRHRPVLTKWNKAALLAEALGRSWAAKARSWVWPSGERKR